MFLTWFFNDRVLSTSTPSMVVESDLNTDSSQMVIGGSSILGRRGPLSTIMSDLSPLSFSVLDVIQFNESDVTIHPGYDWVICIQIKEEAAPKLAIITWTSGSDWKFQYTFVLW